MKYKRLFEIFGVENLIRYNTLKQICEEEINRISGSENGKQLQDKYLELIIE